MAVDNPRVIDAVGLEKQTGNVILTISDHLEWDADNEHVLMLQEKINAYLAFVESGEILESYPKAKSKTCVISVIALYHPNETGLRFLECARNTLEGVGIEFRFQQKHFNSPP